MEDFRIQSWPLGYLADPFGARGANMSRIVRKCSNMETFLVSFKREGPPSALNARLLAQKCPNGAQQLRFVDFVKMHVNNSVATMPYLNVWAPFGRTCKAPRGKSEAPGALSWH